jgi:hypothetical protein
MIICIVDPTRTINALAVYSQTASLFSVCGCSLLRCVITSHTPPRQEVETSRGKQVAAPQRCRPAVGVADVTL